MRKPFSVLLLLILSISLSSADTASIPFSGVPLVQNFAKADYLGANQNWSTTCAPNGIMYFGNNEGLLSFDGQWWQLHQLPGNIIVRSTAVDATGRIYSGGLREFGYWYAASDGQLRYHSLSKKLSPEQQPKDEIWKIYTDSKQVIFQSFSSIYVLKGDELVRVEAPSTMLFLFQAEERYYVEAIDDGIFELKEEKLHKLIDASAFGNSRVLSILAMRGGDLLIGTAREGLFRWDGITLKPWDNASNEELKRYQLNNGIKIQDKFYAFGTILNGIYVLDTEGRHVLQLNKSNGLQNNTVLSLALDQQLNLWAGLDNGIDRIEINSSLFYYTDRTGTLGTVYTAALYNENLYIGTNQGLYRSAWPNAKSVNNTFQFELVEGTQGQVWDLQLIDGELLCGHNNGTFSVGANRITWISSITGGYRMQRLREDSNQLLQGTYTGLAAFKKTANKWGFNKKLEGFNEPVQYLQQATRNRVWASGNKGLHLLQLDANHDQVIDSRSYNTGRGLPESAFVNVFDLAGQTVFATERGFYLYDDIADSFQAYHQLNERLGSFSSSNKIIPIKRDHYWFVKKGHLALVSFMDNGQVSIDSMQFAPLSNRMLDYYENVNSLYDGLSLISLDDGFALHNSHFGAQQISKALVPLIRKVEDITDSTSSLFPFQGQELALRYAENNIRIAYAFPHYSANEVQFQHLLEGNARNWSAWNNLAQREFTNLSPGKYVFKVRAKTADGKISPVTTVHFNVLPPWYLSWSAWTIYALLFAVLILLSRKVYRQKLARHQRDLHDRLIREQEELSLRQKQESEQKLMQLKNQQLEKELSGKNRELANSAMNIVYKNELLSNVHDELLQLKDDQGKKLTGDQIRKISKIIADARTDERDWNLFEQSFNEAHENFFKKLKGTYPELVPNDLKLCAYLRMNMSSKEIAALLNITTRGVEIRRYRLRKKLKLQHDQNLSEFLMQL